MARHVQVKRLDTSAAFRVHVERLGVEIPVSYTHLTLPTNREV